MNQLLDSLTYDPETGTLSLQSARYVLMPPALLVEIQKSLEESMGGREVAEVFSQSATLEGSALASRFRDVFGYPPEQVVSTVAFVLTESGFGSVTCEMVNLEGRELVFKILECPFADSYGPSTQPVCHAVLGLLRGVAMTVFESEVSGMEVQCAAKGDSCCRFVVSSS
jgi:predicted hydrocarbon binding protein